jgi:hypothetical protein
MEAKDHDLLQQVHAELCRLRIDFDKISNGTGFPRCAERAQRMDRLGERLKNVESRLLWQDRAIMGTIIALAIKFLWSYLPLQVIMP